MKAMSMRWMRWWIVGYAALAMLVVWSMFAARDRATEQLATPQSVAQWQAWRADVQQQQANPGPIQRRVPKSSEPPALVLMRDYFAVTPFGALVFSTMLYWVSAWLVSGMMSGST